MNTGYTLAKYLVISSISAYHSVHGSVWIVLVYDGTERGAASLFKLRNTPRSLRSHPMSSEKREQNIDPQIAQMDAD